MKSTRKTIETTLKGYASRKNDEDGTTGECETVVNLRECNGAVEVVGGATVMGALSGGEWLVYIDRRAEGDFFITCRNDEVRVHGVRVNGTYRVRSTSIGNVRDNIISMHGVGRMVVIITSGERRYMLYEKDSYRMLATAGAIPTLLVDTIDSAEVRQAVAGGIFSGAYSQWSRPLAEADVKALQSAVSDSYGELIAEEAQKGRYVQPVAVRYGVRLWDDSYLWISAPVIVGNGVQCGGYTQASVNDGMTGYGVSSLVATSYRIGLTVMGATSSDWDSLIKSIDVFTSDEAKPMLSSGEIDYRCETAQSGERKFYLSYSLKQRERAVANATLINPESWRLACRITDLEGLRAGKITAATVSIPAISGEGALAASAHSMARTGLYSTLLTRAAVSDITGRINHHSEDRCAVSLNGRLYSAPYRRVAEKPWSPAGYWRSNVTSAPCKIAVIAKLKTSAGMAVTVDTRNYGVTPRALNTLIAYPDERAQSVEIVVQSGGEVKRWQGLLQGTDGGIAYFMNKDFSTNELVTATDGFPLTEESGTAENISSEISISANENPFVAEQTRKAGNGNITHLAAVCKPIYSSVFGRYPLYAFTGDGIYALAYRSSGDYKDAQLIDRRTALAESAIAYSGDTVYFISSGHRLCAIKGKDVREVLTATEAIALAWDTTHEELWMASPTGKVEVLMKSGRTYERSQGVTALYGDYYNAVATLQAQELADIHAEGAGMMAVSFRSYPIKLRDDKVLSPIGISWNLIAETGQMELQLSGKPPKSSEEKVLCSVNASGGSTYPLRARIYAKPQRNIIVSGDGQLKSGSQLREIVIDNVIEIAKTAFC